MNPRTLPLRIAAFLALSILCVQSANANQPLRMGVRSQPESPVQINECFGGLSDTDVGNVDYYVNEAVIFTNKSETTVNAIRFRFDFYNVFGEHLDERYGTDTGTFSPNVLIDHAHNHLGVAVPEWQSINIWPSIAAIVCSVDTIAFSDGQLWHAGEARQTALTGLPISTPSLKPAKIAIPEPFPTRAPRRASATQTRTHKRAGAKRIAAAPEPTMSPDPQWSDVSRPCDEIVINGALGRATSSDERDQIVQQNANIATIVKACEKWRLQNAGHLTTPEPATSMPPKKGGEK